MQMAMRQLDGELSKLIQNFDKKSLNTLAQVEVNIDIQNDDVEEMTFAIVAREDAASLTRHSRIAKHGKQGKFCVTA